MYYQQKVLPCPCLPDMPQALLGVFKWGAVWSSISKGISFIKVKVKATKRPVLISKFGNLVILMPLGIKFHILPHLKALHTVQARVFNQKKS